METAAKTINGVSDAVPRRTFLRTSAAASAGLAGVLLTKTPPARGQDRELKMITWSHFIPDTAAEHATGKLEAEAAVQKAEAQMKRLYRRQA